MDSKRLKSCVKGALALMKLGLRTLLLTLIPGLVAGLAACVEALEPLPEKAVVLTFDDGVKSHYTIVRPLLKELGFSATFFITEGFDFPMNKRDFMSWQEIRQLHLDGFEIGNHTRDHQPVPQTLARLDVQIEAINAKCRKYGIPRPVSFAYPANEFHFDALPVLEAAGFLFARRGGSPEQPYDQGRGVAYVPGEDHPLLVPSAGDARPFWTLDDFKAVLGEAAGGGIPVLQFHGVPDRRHPWVSTPPDLFRQYMAYLKKEGYRVLAMRDLARYVDPSDRPADPGAVLRRRLSNPAGEAALH